MPTTPPSALSPCRADAGIGGGARRIALAALALCVALLAALPAAGWAADFSSPLPGSMAGDPARGRAIVANRQVGLCLLCHSGPIPEERFQGNLAPPLDGAGDRSTAAQLRQRLVDAASINPVTIMPSYFRTEGLTRVSPAHKGKTILTAQQIEDVIAYLQTLRAEPAK
jgi:sulfur-oxidizing protein SoxX